MATYGTSNQFINYSVNSQLLSQDINSNSSVIRVWIDVWRTSSGYQTYGSGTVYARINGGVYTAGIGPSQVITSTPIRLGTWEVRVYHESNGTKTVGISGWISHDAPLSSPEQGYNWGLTTIPRASSMDSYSCSTKYIDGTHAIKFTPKVGSFYYKLRMSIPNVVAISTTSLGNKPVSQQSITFNFTSDNITTIMGRASATSPNINIGAVIETYSDSGYTNKIGESSESILSLEIPASYAPTFTSVTATLVDGFNNLYLKGGSKCKLTINDASAPSGTSISSYSIIAEGEISYSGSENIYTTAILNTAGSLKFTATVTDSRGRTAVKTCSITVTDYSIPTLTMECYRATSGSVRDDASGNYILVKPIFTYKDLPGNTITSKYLTIGGTSKSSTFSNGVAVIYGPYGLNTEYEVVCAIGDSVGSRVEISTKIGIASVPFSINSAKNGLGIGTYARRADAITLGKMPYYQDRSIIDWIVPIGTQIYNSKSDFDPNTYYPGTTWKRLKGNLLGGINEGDTDTNKNISFNQASGTVIGSKHIQNHNHGFSGGSHAFVWGRGGMVNSINVPNAIANAGSPTSNSLCTSHGVYDKTDYVTGAGDAGNIPPTILTYIWERTA